ncbi:MAG: type II toxin-antitoxin system ParD family antitoxin [Chromatiales bacterium]|jgi:antitoxin ParD1/3/4|nr:type II toxin-antitoxin system ParD family antitoxin [Chromatiales bacterium]MDX9768368.1 type II toxin-antitoxin system ParD family antitoxin [Ectothiorhodospiraceae bacterium]
MATMNISLPDAMKRWVEQQGQSGRYSNSSDYVRDLIRRDHERAMKIAHLQVLAAEGLESGVGERGMEELKAVAARMAGV